MRRKLLVAIPMTAAAVLLGPASAWANDCANLSRGAGNAVAWETSRGRWFFIEPDIGPIWVFGVPDNFRNGTADALLEGSAACNGSRLLGQAHDVLDPRQPKGIWSEQCFNDALADLGG